MKKFKNDNIIEFFNTFKTDKDCLEYIASIKWKDGFKCSKCNHANFTIRELNFARVCNFCYRIESPTANTLFHKVKFGTRKAFGIIYEMSAASKELSSSQIAKRYSISRPTASLFANKVHKAMKENELFSIFEIIFVNESVYTDLEDLKQGMNQ